MATIGIGLVATSLAQASDIRGNAIEVPGTASLNAAGSGFVNGISCKSSGNCSAIGSYTDASQNAQGFVVNETKGKWGNAIEVPGSKGLSAHGGLDPLTISCGSTANCSAGGLYYDNSSSKQAFVVNETNSKWGNAIEVPGSNALNVGGNASLDLLSCKASGSCGAIGSYNDGSIEQAFVVNESNGKWSKATAMLAPSDFDTQLGLSFTSLSCGSPGNCSAGGNYSSYSDIDQESTNQAFVVAEVNGVWGNAIEVPDVASLTALGSSYLNSISCGSAGNCSAGGVYYVDYSGQAPFGSDHQQAFVVSETNNVWGNAINVPGLDSINVGSYASVSSVACASPGNCTAVGSYAMTTNDAAFAVSEINSVWGDAAEIPGTTPLNPPSGAPAVLVSCSSTGTCSAGGDIGHFETNQAFVANESNGAWSNAFVIPGTSALNRGDNATVSAISCSSAGTCSAGGSYLDRSSNSQAFVVNISAPTSSK